MRKIPYVLIFILFTPSELVAATGEDLTAQGLEEKCNLAKAELEFYKMRTEQRKDDPDSSYKRAVDEDTEERMAALNKFISESCQ